MKANELMTNDWVQIVSDAPIMPNEYRRIDWIRTGEVGLDNRKIVTYPYIQPIPLTPKILEKNGFSQDPHNGHIFIFQEKSGEVIYYEYGPNYGLTIDNQFATIQDLKIKYVHELQHCLKLVGIKKDIVL